MSYIDRIAVIAMDDAVVLKKKDAEYGGSWLKRGGVGAFMMLARKWDRLEMAMTREVVLRPLGDKYRDRDLAVDSYDILSRAVCDDREEGLLDDIGDLRRYLLLVEAEIRERMDPKVNHRLDPYSLPDGTCLDGPQDSIH